MFLSFIKISELLEESKFSHITRNLFMTMAANGKLADASKVKNNFSFLYI